MNDKKTKIPELPDIEQIKTFTDEELKEFFPSMYKELSKEAQLSSEEIKKILEDNLQEDETQSDIQIEEASKLKEKDYLQGFDPKAEDFIRRAKTETEALEVLSFLEKRGELTSKEVELLKKQLMEEGLESFGEYKKHGYYFEYQKQKHLEEKMKLQRRQPK